MLAKHFRYNIIESVILKAVFLSWTFKSKRTMKSLFNSIKLGKAPSCYFFFFFNSFYLFIYLFIFGCVGSSVRARAFSSCGKRGPLFIAVWGPLFITVRGPFTIAAPPVAGHRLQMRRLSSRGSRAQLPRGMWDLPRPGLEPVSPALAGRFSTTAPPGKPSPSCFLWHFQKCHFLHFYTQSILLNSYFWRYEILENYIFLHYIRERKFFLLHTCLG